MADTAKNGLRKYLSANCTGGLFPTLGDDAEAAIDRINSLEREAQAHVTHTTARETKYRDTFAKLEEVRQGAADLRQKLAEAVTTARKKNNDLIALWEENSAIHEIASVGCPEPRDHAAVNALKEALTRIYDKATSAQRAILGLNGEEDNG